jgi:hypothetical protein
MFKSQLFILIVAFLAGKSDALAQPPSSRRTFVGRLVTTGAVVVTAGAANPGSARAIGSRGGKDMIDATHNGTELNGKQAVVASGLLGKMGVDDITPDRGSRYNTKAGSAKPAATAQQKSGKASTSSR